MDKLTEITNNSLKAKLEAAGIHSKERTEELRGSLREAELGGGKNKEYGDIVAETIRNIEKERVNNRNHEGNGRQAGPELATALKEAGVLTAEERKSIVAQFNNEKRILRAEIKEAKERSQKARAEKDFRAANNWEVRLKKSEDILRMYREADSLIDSDAGKTSLENLRSYAKTRYNQAEKELAADSFEKTAKFAAYTPDATPIEDAETPIAEQNKLGGEETKLTPSERVSYPEKLLEIEKTDVGVYDETEISRAMQRDMDTLSTTTEKGTLTKLTPSETISYPQEETETQATYDNWQEDAIERFENEGGRILETPHQENLSISPENEAILNKIEEITTSTKAPELELLETSSQENQPPLETQKKPRPTLEETLTRIQKVEARVEERERNLGEKAMGHIRNIGEAWNKFPLRYKHLITIGMLASGIGAVATGSIMAAGAITVIGAGMRAVGAAGIFYGIETALKNHAEKGGKERSNAIALRDTATAAAVSIFVMGVLPGLVRDYAIEHGAVEKLHELDNLLRSSHAPSDDWLYSPVEEMVEGGTAAETTAGVTYIEVAQAGDSVWSMTERQLEASLGEKFTALSPEQQTYLIDAVKDQVVAHPDQFGLTDANVIQVGQGIDFGIILNDQEFMTNALTEAKGLSGEELANLGNHREVAIPTAYAEEVPYTEAQAQEIPITETSPAHGGPTVEAGGLKVTFQYSPDGKLIGYSTSEVTNFTQYEEAQKLLNDTWKTEVRGHSSLGSENLNLNIVNNRAATLFQYDQILNALEQQGRATSPEATLVRETLERLVADTEKEYGDVFKDATELFKPEQAVSTATLAAPQETYSTDPQILTAAGAQFHNRVTEVFGSKGFLGFGAIDGLKTNNWADPNVGFANKTVEEIMNAKPTTLPGGEVKHFGIEDPSAVNKMQDYFKKTFIETGVQPKQGETAATYLERVSLLSVIHKE